MLNPGNRLAPAWLAGLWSAPEGTREEYAEFVLAVELAANAESLGNALRVDGDSCFIWRATGIVVDEIDGAALYFRIRDHRGKYMSQTPLLARQWGPGINSIPNVPEFEIPRGMELAIDFYEQGGEAATANLVIRGVKRFTL